MSSLRAVDEEAWAAQRAAGVARVALDGTPYDQVLDMVAGLGLAPPRFKVGAGGGLDTRRARARACAHRELARRLPLAPSIPCRPLALRLDDGKCRHAN